MDFFPTISNLVNVDLPKDRKIDGNNVLNTINNPQNAEITTDFFAYYNGNNLEAIRNKQWKLHFQKGAETIRELYDLKNDIGEQNNLFDKNPEMVALIMFENSEFNFAGDLAPFLKKFILYYYKLESEVN